MDAIYFLIPLTFLILVIAVAVFFWAVNNNQYDDLDKEAHRILFDDLDTVHDEALNEGANDSVTKSSETTKRATPEELS